MWKIESNVYSPQSALKRSRISKCLERIGSYLAAGKHETGVSKKKAVPVKSMVSIVLLTGLSPDLRRYHQFLTSR